MLRLKITEAAEALEQERIKLDGFRTLQIAEEAALGIRLERIEDEVRVVKAREMEAQEIYRKWREEVAWGAVSGKIWRDGDCMIINKRNFI